MKSQNEIFEDFPSKRILIYAIGNEGRQDDGLAHEFVKSLPESDVYDIHQNYQLNVEDAELITQYEQVLFVDAAKNQIEAFKILYPQAKPEAGFTTHGLSIEGIMAMSQDLFGKTPKVSLLAIQGEQFGLKIGLSEKGQENLKEARHWFFEIFQSE